MRTTPILAPTTIDAQEAPRIRRYVSRLVGAQEAEDLVQEVFARAHSAIESHRGEPRLTTWLFRIATNAAIDHLRRFAPQIVMPARTADGRDPMCESGCAEPPEGSDCASAAPSAEADLIRDEMRRCMAQMVSSLPASSAAVLVEVRSKRLDAPEDSSTAFAAMGLIRFRGRFDCGCLPLGSTTRDRDRVERSTAARSGRSPPSHASEDAEGRKRLVRHHMAHRAARYINWPR